MLRECLDAPAVAYHEHRVVLRNCGVRAGRSARNTLDDEATHVIRRAQRERAMNIARRHGPFDQQASIHHCRKGTAVRGCKRKLRSHSRPVRLRTQLRPKAACRDVLHPSQTTIAVCVRVNRYHGLASRRERVQQRPHSDADEDCNRQRHPSGTLHVTLFSRKSTRSDRSVRTGAWQAEPDRGPTPPTRRDVRTRLLRLCETIGRATARYPSAPMHADAHPRRASCWPAGTTGRCSIPPAIDSWHRRLRA